MDILPSLLESDLLHSISLTLLHFLWQGLAIAGILLCVKKLTSNKHSELRYLVSLLSLTLCVIAPTITFLLISQPEQTSFATPPLASSSVISVATQADVIGQLYLSDFTPLIAVAWMCGVALLSVRLGWQMLQVHKLTTTNIVQPSDKLEQIFNQLKLQLSVAKRSRLVISLTAQVPMAIGWIKPVVLLPANLASGLTIAQLEMLMAHELAHIKRYDYLVNLIQTFVELVLFFHPAVKWISKQIRIEREYCCDDIALHHCGNHLHYARALTEAEVLRQNIPELAMAATGGDLKSRIHRAVGQHSCAPRYGNQWLAALAAVLVIPSIFTASKVIAMTQAEPIKTTPLENQHVMVLDAKPVETKKVEASKPLIISAQVPSNTFLDSKNNKTELKETVSSQVTQSASNELPEPESADPIAQADIVNKQTVYEQEEPIETPEIVSLATKDAVNTEVEFVEYQELAIETQDSNEETQTSVNLEMTNVTTRAFEQSQPVIIEEQAITPSEITETEELTKAVSTPIEKTKFVEAKLLESVMPEYPRVFSNLQGQEDISVTFTVDVNGKITDIEYQSGVPRSFKRTISRALQKWRFEPALQGDTKVETKVSKVFSFNDPSQFLRPVTGSRIARRY
ncbi:M56 family metallopeptidase [Pseudoalteromonas sp. G4]|uniref:M56 family metallopeptidase n=1 Tax=Pseudoalteromonas sp. G4 TaxID=2992761 RepID=UPI00237D7F93|nr:M56 family metallopeptidase [Pseudoalteromonas sp. G4]MDE3271628.1 energy transducer TonB [Pseudoalteromonas sp. G4]